LTDAFGETDVLGHETASDGRMGEVAAMASDAVVFVNLPIRAIFLPVGRQIAGPAMGAFCS
jgi:hypothetical protein